MKILVTVVFLLFSLLKAEDTFKYIKPVSVETISKKDINKEIEALLSDDGTVAKEVKVIANDADGDGVSDEIDKCADTPQGVAVNENGCELDSDGDGIVDSKDQCPETDKEFLVDERGCPELPKTTIQFKPKQQELTPAMLDELQKFADYLNKHDTYHAIVYGYSDDVGDEDENKRLSYQRAKLVLEALVKLGVHEVRLTAVGRGSENPLAENSTPEGRSQNRRVEIELLR